MAKSKIRWTKSMNEVAIYKIVLPYLSELHDQMLKDYLDGKTRLNPNRTRAFLIYVAAKVK